MINKEMLNDFRKDFEQAVRSLEDKYNLKLELGTITYNELNQNFTASLKALDNRGGEQASFNRYCSWYGLTPEDYKKRFIDRRHVYEIVGIDTRSKKYPIIVRDIETGNEVRYTSEYIRNNII